MSVFGKIIANFARIYTYYAELIDEEDYTLITN